MSMPTLSLAELGLEITATLRERNLRITELEFAVVCALKALSRDEVTKAERLLQAAMAGE